MATVTRDDIMRAGGFANWMRQNSTASSIKADSLQEKTKAKVRKPDAILGFQGERMNKLESEYAVYLERLRMSGEICLWKFGQFKLRMADKTWYAPDFFVINKAGVSEFHETKGYMRDDANVKLKTCAELYREFNFYLVRKVKDTWDIKSV